MSVLRYEFLGDEEIAKLKEVDQPEPALVKVAELKLDYEFELNPLLFELSGTMKKWFDEHRKYLPFLKSDETPYMSILAAYAYPIANLSQLEGVVITLMWGITFDDEIMEESQDLAKIAAIKDTYLKAFSEENLNREYLEQIKETSIYCYLIMLVYFKYEPSMTENHKKRFKELLQEYVSAGAKEVEIVSSNDDKRFAKFFDVRLETSTYKIYALLSEICSGMDTSTYEDPLFRENQLSITILMTLINDTYSYNKELDIGFLGNTVYQLQHHAKCLPQTAMRLAEQMFEKEKNLFDLNCNEILKKYAGNVVVEKYIKAMKALAFGNYQVCNYYQRYTIGNEKACLLQKGSQK